MSTDTELATEFAGAWVNGATLTPLAAMNSTTWAVDAGAERFVLKVAGASDEPGLLAASCLESHGVPTGAPLRMALREGRLVALLRYVDGTPLVASDAATVGATLGRVHVALRDCTVPPGMDRWPWGWVVTDGIADRDLREKAAAAIRSALDTAPGLTHGILHGDPAPEAFLAGSGGEDVALIDWGAACHGPLLYDLASAVMYAGPDVLPAYRESGPLGGEELDLVDVFRAFRWAVQAIYFSGRIAANDLTGIEDQSENEKGLQDARTGLHRL